MSEPLIDIRPDHWAIVADILRQHVLDREVWAFGSRATWNAKEYSDLDLAVIGETPLSLSVSAALADHFAESDLPFKVDVVDWATTRESFRTIIERDKVVAQEAYRPVVAVLPSEWAEKCLGDLIEIKHGFAFKGEFFRDEPPGDILLTPGNFDIGGGFKADKFKYYDGPVPDEFVLCEGDLIVTMTDLSKNADTLGYPAFVASSSEGRRYLHNQRLGKVVAKEKNAVDFRYLHYLMCSQEYRHEVVAGATGTTVKHTSPERIKRFRFRLPPPPEQRAIAHILGTLDDKIELNRRMNETLEATARALFKSWFVDFDPVRAKMEGRDPGLPKFLADLFPARLVDSELGEIPEGWNVGCVDDEFDLTMGQSPPGDTYNEVGDGLPFYQGRADFGFRFPTRRVYCTAPSRLAKARDTLISVRAPVGDVNIASEDCAIGRGVAATRHKTRSRSYSYQFMRSLEVVFARFEAEGTVFGSIGKKDFHAIPCVVPPRDVVVRFETILSPVDSRIEGNERESRTLAAVRDALLPKLISGALRVKDTERFIKRAV